MKLGLGTVQFGCDYGISNTKGQVLIDEVVKILDYALKNGIDIIDTASLYGNSEAVLGQFDLSKFKVVTKTSKVNYKISTRNLFMGFYFTNLMTCLENSRMIYIYLLKT